MLESKREKREGEMNKHLYSVREFVTVGERERVRERERERKRKTGKERGGRRDSK